MAKEKIIYTFGPELPAKLRRKIPEVDRKMILYREEHYRNDVIVRKPFKWKFTMAERLMIECEIGEFPKRFPGDEPETLKEGIEQFIERLRKDRES